MIVKEFLESKFEFSEAESRCLKRSNTFLKKSVPTFISMSYETVIDLKNKASLGDMFGVVKILTNHKEEEVLKANHTAFVYFLKWIEDEFLNIKKLEDSLGTDVDDDLKEAGIHEMEMFKELNVIDSLAGGDILKWKEIGRLTYQEVFTKLLKMKKEKEISDNLEIIKKRKK